MIYDSKRPDNMALVCTMVDGSEWRCNLDGTNWEKVTPSFEELTNKFNKQNI